MTLTRVFPITLSRGDLEKILPLDESLLRLDSVVIDDTKARGEYIVTPEVCKGHNVFGSGEPNLRGAELSELAAQFLASCAWILFPVLQEVQAAVLVKSGPRREYFFSDEDPHSEEGEAIFKRVIWPGDKLIITTSVGSIVVYPQNNHLAIEGHDFLIRAIRSSLAFDEARAKVVAEVSLVKFLAGKFFLF